MCNMEELRVRRITILRGKIIIKELAESDSREARKKLAIEANHHLDNMLAIVQLKELAQANGD